MSLLDIRHLESGYGGQSVVRGVSIAVQPGEVVAVIGATGAGKSTMLDTIVGLVKPQRGSVSMNGHDITGLDPEKTLENGIAYVPQTRNIFPSLTVQETLEVCFKRSDFAVAFDEILQLFPRLRQRLRSRAGLLSGGERQMLAIARALINRPFELIIMDEPSAALSVDNVRSIFERISWIRSQGIAVLLVEQNALKALEISDRAYVIESGRVVAEDTASALLESPTIAELFLGVRHS